MNTHRADARRFTFDNVSTNHCPVDVIILWHLAADSAPTKASRLNDKDDKVPYLSVSKNASIKICDNRKARRVTMVTMDSVLQW